MNKDNARDYLPLVQALAEGKTIEFLNSNAQWEDCEYPSFNQMPVRYRIKPEPKKIHLNIAFHKDKSGYWCRLVTGNTVTDLARVEQSDSFVKWLDHLEYELPEGYA